LTILLNTELRTAWGEPGVASSDIGIVAVCGLFVDACLSVLHWEERVRFIDLPTEFEELQRVLVGTGGILFDQVAKISPYLSDIYSNEPKPGRYHLSLTFKLPDGWQDRFNLSLKNALNKLI
jgi:hypothetical protein